MKHRLLLIIALLILFVAFMSFDGTLSGNFITGYAGRAESTKVVLETTDAPQLHSYQTFVKRGRPLEIQMNFGKYGVHPIARFVKNDGTFSKQYILCDGIGCYGSKNLRVEISRSLNPGAYTFKVSSLLHPDQPIILPLKIV